MPGVSKTNAMRILERLGLAYEAQAYAVDESDLGAGHLAAQLGVETAMVFKTLVLRGDRTGFFVCVLPGDLELDLKKAAKASENKSCAMIPMKDLQAVTGYIRGGCSPVGMTKSFPTLVDSLAELWPKVYVNAGRRGLVLRLAPADLVKACGGRMADISA